MYNIIDIEAKTELPGAYAIIQIQDLYFLVDKAETPDAGWETMVFSCDRDGNISDWLDLWVDRTGKSLYQCMNEFAHEYVIQEIEKHNDEEGN